MEKDLKYHRQNAEEEYMTTPISVLRYISEMENQLFAKNGSVGLRDIMVSFLMEIDECYGTHVRTKAESIVDDYLKTIAEEETE